MAELRGDLYQPLPTAEQQDHYQRRLNNLPGLPECGPQGAMPEHAPMHGQYCQQARQPTAREAIQSRISELQREIFQLDSLSRALPLQMSHEAECAMLDLISKSYRR